MAQPFYLLTMPKSEEGSYLFDSIDTVRASLELTWHYSNRKPELVQRGCISEWDVMQHNIYIGHVRMQYPGDIITEPCHL